MTPAQEEWRPVLGYEGMYEVSNLGRVRSLDRLDSIGRPVRGRLLRQAPADAGRVTVELYRLGGGRTMRPSVLVLAAFVGPRPAEHEGCHNNGDPTDNRLVNLRWDTSSANKLDAVQHGTNAEVRKTHCPRNHPLTAPNLSPSRARLGRRVCLACHRALCARRRAQLRGEPFDMQRESDERFADIMRAA